METLPSFSAFKFPPQFNGEQRRFFSKSSQLIFWENDPNLSWMELNALASHAKLLNSETIIMRNNCSPVVAKTCLDVAVNLPRFWCKVVDWFTFPDRVPCFYTSPNYLCSACVHACASVLVCSSSNVLFHINWKEDVNGYDGCPNCDRRNLVNAPLYLGWKSPLPLWNSPLFLPPCLPAFLSFFLSFFLPFLLYFYLIFVFDSS